MILHPFANEQPDQLNTGIYPTLICRYKAPFTAKAWMDKFKHVVGVIHTNYLSYTRTHTLGQIKEPLVYYINQGNHVPIFASCTLRIICMCIVQYTER